MTFDFEAHRMTAIKEYTPKYQLYQDFADVIRDILIKALAQIPLKVHSIEARAKTPENFSSKAAAPSEKNPNQPKYDQPLEQITDLAGVRVITFLPRTVDEVCKSIEDQFEVVERVDHGISLLQQERFGYQSIHFIIRLSNQRLALPEYRRYKELKAEIQVRTILQHAWAEIEHDIGYKSSHVIPTTIRRRFAALAGMLEIADREFEAIQNEDLSLRTEAIASIQEGMLDTIEITPYVLKAYLDKRLGSDARMSDFSYEWEARLLHNLGFYNLKQVNECIEGFNDDSISRIISGGRQGQITRFDYLLLASMGEVYIIKHPWNQESWFTESERRTLKKLRDAGIKGKYAPS